MANPTIAANSVLDSLTITSSPTANASYPVSRLNDDRTYTMCKMGSSATTWDLITDAGSGNTSSVNYFSMIGHDGFAPAGAGAACAWAFARSTDGVTYTTITSGTFTDNLVVFRLLSSTLQYRFFRLRITRGAAFIMSIGQLQWGVAMEFPWGVELGFDPQQETIDGQLNRSQTGNILGAIRTFSRRENRVRIPLVLDSFVRGTTVGQFAEFWNNHGRLLKPFFFSWNPGDPGSFEKDTYWAVIKPSFDLKRELATSVASGYRHIEFTVEGQKEEP